MNSDALGFRNIILEYLAGKVDWEFVHQHAVQMEFENKANFAESDKALYELHTIFLTADSTDDSQFRATREEIVNLLAQTQA